MNVINIIVCSAKKEGTLFSMLYNTLENNGGVCAHYNNNIKSSCSSPRYNLYSMVTIPTITNISGIIVFDSYFKTNNIKQNLSGLTPVFESKNKKAISMLNGTNALPVSCGTGNKDTLSVASIDENKALISLQRDIQSVYGKIIEPQDFTVKLYSNCKLYYTLAIAAVELLLEL